MNLKIKQIFISFSLYTLFSIGTVSELSAQQASTTSPRFRVGGYGEAVMQRMFYSGNVARYTRPENYKDEKHGQFDLPHVVLYTSYNFGRGWKFSSEIEFEHGGTGTTYEIENSESGEYESEIEKGGEVALEQFWIEKTWTNYANLRMGHIIVPIGLTNQYHMPTEFFSVLRPEEESAILPCTWHQTGISFWGRTKQWRYEALFISGLGAELFNNANWIHGGATSPYEFTIANSYATAVRLDNYSVKGLRIGLSGYYGLSANNTLKPERYKNISGAVAVGTIDAVYNDHNVLARTNILYGHLGDSYAISTTNKKLPSASPSFRTDVASDALSWYVEAGYDVLSFFPNRQYQGNKLYLYGHYGYYNSMYKTAGDIPQKKWCEKTLISGGVNYYPLPGLVVKGEYSFRKFKAPYNNEPTLSLGIAYAGMFER
ncbi:hypothetical protein EZS27_007297 [termite gut metagenome]|uniref:Uncharacterized protein n=1 Tax=termite gut metagenome TaxID=433724 RepID=A0A5J4SIK0_9ZZZZ